LLEVNELGETLRLQRLGAFEATALLRTIMAEIDVAVFTFDPERKLRLVNRAGENLLKRPIDKLLGRTARELRLDVCLEANEDAPLTLAFPGATGRWGVRRSTFREHGLPNELLVLTDLSRTLREEERIAWQRLVRVLGHELNNSLAPIKSLAGTLRDMLGRQACEPDVLEGLSLMGDRADSLSKFVATYSQLARLPAPNKLPISLNALLHRLVALPAYAGVRVSAPFETEVPADAGQLEQALINLLKNAVEASNGVVTDVEIAVARTRDAVIIEIRDTGPGIANPDNLFVPFFTTKPGGSGIGLALSRQIVEAHTGTLAVENRADGQGAVARLSIPAPLET
jgi:nitrogen fixation/metabolism regulation signal transduction histidine kinase